jgi:hypothetical protein
MKLMEENAFTAGVIFPMVLIKPTIETRVDVGELIVLAPQ